MDELETAEFLRSKRGPEARKSIETVTILRGINRVGELAVRNLIYDSLLEGIETTPLSTFYIESELCELSK